LPSFAADFISADYSYLRQITECAADLVSDQSPRGVESFAVVLKGDGSLSKFPLSDVGRGQNSEMQMRTSTETRSRCSTRLDACIGDLSPIEIGDANYFRVADQPSGTMYWEIVLSQRVNRFVCVN
jgi:hypothetical protein